MENNSQRTGGLSGQKHISSKVVILLLSAVFLVCAILIYSNGINNDEQVVGQKQATENAPQDAQKVAIKTISADDITFKAINGDGSGYSNINAVMNGSVEIGRIEWKGENGSFTLVKVGQNTDSLFLTSQPVGIGGNFLVEDVMGQDLWRVDLKAGTMEKLYERKGWENVEAVSPDGKLLAVVDSTQAGIGMVRLINLPQGNENSVFSVPERYNQVGHITFSPDNKKVIFEAATSEAVTKDAVAGEKVAFAADIDTKAQRQFVSYKEAAAWAGVNYVEPQVLEEQ